MVCEVTTGLTVCTRELSLGLETLWGKLAACIPQLWDCRGPHLLHMHLCVCDAGSAPHAFQMLDEIPLRNISMVWCVHCHGIDHGQMQAQ